MKPTLFELGSRIHRYVSWVALILVAGVVAFSVIVRPDLGRISYDAIARWESRFHTDYAAGFNVERFQAVKLGDSVQTVRSELGEPLVVRPQREVAKRVTFMNGGIEAIVNYSKEVVSVSIAPEHVENAHVDARRYKSLDGLISKFGTPEEGAIPLSGAYWGFSESERGSHFRQYAFLVTDSEPARVVMKINKIYYD